MSKAIRIAGATEIKANNVQEESNVTENVIPEKKLHARDFEFPRLVCDFCGRPTLHSANGKVCLICGSVSTQK